MRLYDFQSKFGGSFWRLNIFYTYSNTCFRVSRKTHYAQFGLVEVGTDFAIHSLLDNKCLATKGLQ
jgi:hypothetical protein